LRIHTAADLVNDDAFNVILAKILPFTEEVQDVEICIWCWKTSPQLYRVMRLVGESSWQESDQSDNFDRWSKFLEIPSTTIAIHKF